MKAAAEIFEEGCMAAERSGNLATLAILNAAYGGLRGNNLPICVDFVRYAAEGVRIADRTDDAALSAMTRSLLIYGLMYCGQLTETERVANEIAALTMEDPHRGAEFVGVSPMMCAHAGRLHAVGRMRDPATALREFSRARQAAVEAGYPEQALWLLESEIALKYALGHVDDLQALSQMAKRFAENLGPVNEIVAAMGQCDALASADDWCALSEFANAVLRRNRELSLTRPREPRLLAHIGLAQLELGNLDAGRAAAQEAVDHMREYQNAFDPYGYVVLVRAQLALAEPTADIAGTLEEYEALLTRTGFHVYEGELHELRGRLAECEGQKAERTAALARAHDCYTRFGRTAQAARACSGRDR